MSQLVFHGLFCDDIRHEIGNKFTLVGCYGNDLYVPKLPVTLPRLCVHFSLQVLGPDKGADVDADDVIVSLIVDGEEKTNVKFQVSGGTHLNGGFDINGQELKEGSCLKLKATRFDQEYIGATLTVKERPLGPMPQAAASAQ